MCVLDEIRARCACRGAIRSPEVAKQRAATRSQEAAREEIYAIARAHKAEKHWVFGSCARKEETPESDVDFLVEFVPATTIFDYVKLKDSLSQVLGRNVDVVDSFAMERGDRFSIEVAKDRVAV